MTTGWTIAVFAGCLALSAVSSLVLAEGLERIGARLGFSEGLQGIVTALGADSPEIAAALAALMAGSSEMGVGVVLGSNVFNLAALLGLSAIVAGEVRVGTQGLLLNGVVAVAVTAVTVPLVYGRLSAGSASGIVTCLLVPYVFLSSLRPGQVRRVLPAGRVRRFIEQAVDEGRRDNRKDRTAPEANWRDVLPIIPALACIVGASFGLVNAATRLGNDWHVPHAILGILVLATLTGVPNVLAAVRLARHGRGAAVLSETLNSNSINVIAGICLPALFLGIGSASHVSRMAAWWLLPMTAASVILTCIRGGLHRIGGLAIIIAYAAFVGTVLWL